MFHKINRVELPALEKLNKIAYQTVAFALKRTTSDKEKTIQKEFVAHLATHGYPLAGEWLWRKPETIRKPLLNLLNEPVADRIQILDVLEKDRDLEAAFTANHFHYASIPAIYAKARLYVSDLYQNFYSVILSEGIPGEIINESTDCNRQSFLRAYLLKQKIKVCPACDGAPPSIDAYADLVREDIDHFFPKAKYPHWSIHPLNLCPFCKTCNQDYKGSKDAIRDQDSAVSHVSSPEHIYHPYLRPAHEEIDVIVDLDVATQQPHLILKTKVNDPVQQARLDGLNYMLRLESRWNGELNDDRLHSHVQLGLKQIQLWLTYSTQYERDIATPLDENYLKHVFSVVLATINSSKGLISGSVPAAAYCQWLETSPTEYTKYFHQAQQALI